MVDKPSLSMMGGSICLVAASCVSINMGSEYFRMILESLTAILATFEKNEKHQPSAYSDVAYLVNIETLRSQKVKVFRFFQKLPKNYLPPTARPSGSDCAVRNEPNRMMQAPAWLADGSLATSGQMKFPPKTSRKLSFWPS